MESSTNNEEATHFNITVNLPAYTYVDKDTQQIVIYIPSLDVSGYGETMAKAREMLQSSISDHIAPRKVFSQVIRVQLE